MLRRPPLLFRQNANVSYTTEYEEKYNWWRIEARPFQDLTGPAISIQYIWPDNRLVTAEERATAISESLAEESKKELESNMPTQGHGR